MLCFNTQFSINKLYGWWFKSLNILFELFIHVRSFLLDLLILPLGFKQNIVFNGHVNFDVDVTILIVRGKRTTNVV